MTFALNHISINNIILRTISNNSDTIEFINRDLNFYATKVKSIVLQNKILVLIVNNNNYYFS